MKKLNPERDESYRLEANLDKKKLKQKKTGSRKKTFLNGAKQSEKINPSITPIGKAGTTSNQASKGMKTRKVASKDVGRQ